MMIAIGQLTDEHFERHALDLLQRESGPDGLDHLLRLNRAGMGDYTRGRDQWQKVLTARSDSRVRPANIGRIRLGLGVPLDSVPAA